MDSGLGFENDKSRQLFDLGVEMAVQFRRFRYHSRGIGLSHTAYRLV